MTGVGLLDLAIQFAGGVPHGHELPLSLLANEHGDHSRQRHDQHGDAGQQRADREHHDRDAEHGEHRVEQLPQRLLQRLLHIVHVVGHPAEQFAAGLRVEIAERQAVHLRPHLVAHPEGGALDGPVQQVVLQEAEGRGHQVEAERQHQPVPKRAEIDALAGDDRHARQQVGQLVLTAGAQHVDDLLLGHAGGQILADDPGKDHICGLAQDLRAHDGSCHRGDTHEHDDREPRALGFHESQQPHQRGPEVDGLLRDSHSSARTVAQAGCVLGARVCLDRRPSIGVHAASSMLSWDSTISR
ncbi:hypothetical protein SDC9_94259 [bioreactor metagenome]|uniref:Uncharacterized protein n=1 Tax=bioreactor metagenome TaxID=1076179 RepID=A0A645A4C0_9ZZZZ